MVGRGFDSAEMRMREPMREFSRHEELKAVEKMTDGYNRLRDALAWFDSHEVEKKLGHLPEWVVMGRELAGSP